MMLHTITKAYPPAGKCIYCNKTTGPLHREHIIPYALGGRLTLPKASCPTCQKIICQIEDFVARRWLGRFRMRVKLPSQNKKQKFDFDVRVHHRDGTAKMTNIAIEDYPRILGLPVLPEPPILGWMPTREPHMWMVTARPDFARGQAAMGGESFDAFPFNMALFCRMLAKIAHGLFVAEVQPAHPELRAVLRSSILTHSVPATTPVEDTLARYPHVGGDPDWGPADRGQMNMFSYSIGHMTDGSQIAMIHLRLFAHWGAPPYLVVAGRTDAEQSRVD